MTTMKKLNRIPSLKFAAVFLQPGIPSVILRMSVHGSVLAVTVNLVDSTYLLRRNIVKQHILQLFRTKRL